VENSHSGDRRDFLRLSQNIVNVDGGAIAPGHPIGATEAVLTTRLIHSMRRDGFERRIVTLCIGGGKASRSKPLRKAGTGS
jgi:acetyl-CoA acetyltransferase